MKNIIVALSIFSLFLFFTFYFLFDNYPKNIPTEINLVSLDKGFDSFGSITSSSYIDCSTPYYIISDSILIVYESDQPKELKSFNYKRISIPNNLTLNRFSVEKYNDKLFLYDTYGNFYQEIDSQIMKSGNLNYYIQKKYNNLKVSSSISEFSRVVHLNDSCILLRVDPINFTNKNTSNRLSSYRTFAKYNIISNNFSLLDYYMPQHYLKFDYSIHNNFHSLIIGSDTIIVSYPYTNHIDLFSIKENKLINSYKLKYCKNLEVSKKFDSKNKHNEFEYNRYGIEVGYYGPLIHNTSLNCFFRVYHPPLPRKNSNNDYTIRKDKETIIILYDKNFKLIGEVKLKKEVFFLMGLTPTVNGFLLNSNFLIQNGTYSIYEYKIKDKK